MKKITYLIILLLFHKAYCFWQKEVELNAIKEDVLHNEESQIQCRIYSHDERSSMPVLHQTKARDSIEQKLKNQSRTKKCTKRVHLLNVCSCCCTSLISPGQSVSMRIYTKCDYYPILHDELFNAD